MIDENGNLLQLVLTRHMQHQIWVVHYVLEMHRQPEMKKGINSSAHRILTHSFATTMLLLMIFNKLHIDKTNAYNT